MPGRCMPSSRDAGATDDPVYHTSDAPPAPARRFARPPRACELRLNTFWRVDGPPEYLMFVEKEHAMAQTNGKNPISDLMFDWVTVLHSKAEGLHAYEKYIKDAERENATE